MAYDEGLAQRIRESLSEQDAVTERKMFGGLAFMVNGHMTCGVVGSELMVRVGKDAYEDALARKHAREMDFTGKSLRGMVYVGADGLSEDEELEGWIRRGVEHALTLPPK